jgi:WD40 repeat protein
MPIHDPELIGPDDFPVPFGRYTLTRLLGEGGMGRVFRAVLQGDAGFSKPYAIKVVRTSALRQNPKLTDSLVQEARIGALLNHPNIVTTNDFNSVDGIPYIAMGLMRGVGLDELLVKGSGLEPGQIVDLARQVCDGLHYAHEFEDEADTVELVHRDLKPGNVFVTRNGVAKILDFGIAKATQGYGDATAVGMAKGTMGYMSPEQFDSATLDRRSDLFALGAVLYEMTMGDALFQGESTAQVMSAIVNVEETLAQRDGVAAVDGKVPGLGPIMHRCLRRDRDKRYPTARVISKELAALQTAYPGKQSLEEHVRSFMTAHRPADESYTDEVTGPQRSRETPPPTRAISSVSSELPQPTQAVDTSPPIQRQEVVSTPAPSGSSLNTGTIIAIVSTLIAIVAIGMLLREGDKKTTEDEDERPQATVPANPVPADTPGTTPTETPAQVDPPETRVRGVDLGRAATPGRPIHTFTGHRNHVMAVAFSADGAQALSGGMDRKARLWDLQGRKLLFTFRGHTEMVTSVALSPVGKEAISASADNSLRLWNIETGRPLRILGSHKGDVSSVAYSPDGQQVVSGSADNTLRLWDVQSGRIIHSLTGHTSDVQSVDFAGDGQTIVSGGGPKKKDFSDTNRDTTVRLWDANTGRLLHTFSGHRGTVRAVAFGANGRLVLSGGFDDRLRLWDVSSQQQIRDWRATKADITTLAFSANGKHALSGSYDRKVKLWDVSNGQLLREFTGHTQGIQAVAFSPDGHYALSGSKEGTLKLWDLQAHVPPSTDSPPL